MNRVINHPDLVVEDMLVGWLSAHPGVSATTNPRVLRRTAAPMLGKVGIVTGGGSGHEPAFRGYLGDGLLDAVAVGEIFSSPTARNFHDAMRAADGGAGVACLYGNYAGDNMNVKMAIEMATDEGITVKTVVANDDVPSAPKSEEHKRRGVAGEIFMWKVAAAAADQGASLDHVIAAAQKAIDNTRSIGIGLSACIIPAVGKANFTIAPGTMEVGIGHHGEPGIDVRKTASAAEMAELMLNVVWPDLALAAQDRVAVLVSGLGATPLMEQYILFGEISKRLAEGGIAIDFSRVGNLFSSLEMVGVTLTLMKLDDELAAWLAAPCQSVGLSVAGVAATQTMPSAPIRVVSNPKSLPKMTNRTTQPARMVNGPSISLAHAGPVVRALIATVQSNREYLSEIDGAIGDGDHGVNMSKGFAACATRLDALGERAQHLPVALEQLSQALMDDIGGSMGPLYGSFFAGLAQTLAPHERLDAALFGDALATAVANVQKMGNAQVGDKTLIDTLAPALDAYQCALANNADFRSALESMRSAAERGKDATRDMQARIGRSARLGPRSIGVLDAGATSCYLLLATIAADLTRQLVR